MPALNTVVAKLQSMQAMALCMHSNTPASRVIRFPWQLTLWSVTVSSTRRANGVERLIAGLN